MRKENPGCCLDVAQNCWNSTAVAINVPANISIHPKMIWKLPFAWIFNMTFSFATLLVQKKCWFSSQESTGFNGRGDVSASADITCLYGKVLPTENNNISFVVFSRLSQAWCCNSHAPSQTGQLLHTLASFNPFSLSETPVKQRTAYFQQIDQKHWCLFDPLHRAFK